MSQNPSNHMGALAAAAAVVLALPVLVVVLIAGLASTPASANCNPGATLTNVKVDALPVQQVDVYGPAQLTNAAIIINESNSRKLGRQAAVIGIMTALVESRLKNHANDGTFVYPRVTTVMSAAQWQKARAVVIESMKYPHQDVGHDWDSIGMFQQRPSAGWGTVAELMNPSYTAKKFYDTLTKLPNWQDLPYGTAAQKVQRSAHPERYDKERATAEKIVSALQGVKVTSTNAEATVANTCSSDSGGFAGTVSAQGWVQPVKTYTGTPSGFGSPRAGYTHMGEDFSAPKNTPIYAAADGKVTRSSCSDLAPGRSPCQIQIDHGEENGQRISTLYVHMFADGLIAKVGDQVKAGDHIGNVGTNGNSTGYHLHFEVWRGQTPVSPIPFLQAHGVTLKP